MTQTMTPQEIVSELDRHIVGQHEAKRAVAIALRNRWRRLQLDEKLREEVMPKNILMIGPTGVGKTEISRRLQTIMERVLDDISFTAGDRSGETVTIDGEYVRSRVADLAKNADLSRFIL